MSSTNVPPQPPAGEQDSPEAKAIRNQTRAFWAQATVSVLAFLVAIYVAWQGQLTVSRNTQTTLRQSEDTQLATAITAIGSTDTAERIAGLLLLARNTAARFTLSAAAGEQPGDVFDDYTTALQILSGYIRSHGGAFLDSTGVGQTATPFGRGYGVPPSPGIPLDVVYAADQVQFMMNKNIEDKVAALHLSPPAIDLANDELIGQPWYGINFGWLSAFLVGVDLRGANLMDSKWSKSSDLSYSYLQCAGLEGADFRGANLSYADLRGANVQGANFRGANLTGAQLTDVYGLAKWPRRQQSITALSVQGWDQPACLKNSKFWDNAPVSASAPVSVHSSRHS